MSEDTKKLFAEMFGGTNTQQETVERKEEPTVIHVDSIKIVERDLVDGTFTLSSREDEPKQKSEDEKKDETSSDNQDDGVDPKLIEDAKEELGMGGAAFCDELLATCPDVFTRLKEQNKTLHGLFNFAYSYALDEYVKKNGNNTGGGYWNLAELAEKYLDPNVKEGFTVSEPKPKKYVPPMPSTSKKDNPVETVRKVSKRAAKAAKKADEKRQKKEAEEAERQKRSEDEKAKSEAINKMFENVDFSKIDFSGMM